MISENVSGGQSTGETAAACAERERRRRIVTVFEAADALFVDGVRATPQIPLDEASSMRLSRVTFFHPEGRRVEHITTYTPATGPLCETITLFSVQATVRGGRATDHQLVDVRGIAQAGGEQLELAESVIAHAAAFLAPKPSEKI